MRSGSLVVPVALVALACLKASAADIPEATTVKLDSAQATSQSAAPQKLADIRSIYVDSFGTSEGAELVRSKIINRLVKSGVIAITENETSADAVLKGGASINTHHSILISGGYLSCRAHHHAQSAVRLVGRDGQVLWIAERGSSPVGIAVFQMAMGGAKPSLSASSNLAEKITLELTKAITKDRAQIAASEATKPGQGM